MVKKTIFVFNGVIVDGSGRILIENRSEKELPSADEKWGLPGGKLNLEKHQKKQLCAKQWKKLDVR